VTDAKGHTKVLRGVGFNQNSPNHPTYFYPLLASRCFPNEMGWFASASTGSPQKSSDGGSIAPSRSSREQCYIARDLFFDCLDEKGIVDATKEDGAARSNCRKQLQEFENACSETWVKYFKEKRVMEHKRSLSIERVKKEDAEMAAGSKLEKQRSGGLWG